MLDNSINKAIPDWFDCIGYITERIFIRYYYNYGHVAPIQSISQFIKTAL